MNSRLPVTIAAIVGASTAYALAQGGLTPTQANGALDGANNPRPSMKTLAQIEPRTDLLTVSGDTDYHHIITTPGSYYLSGNLAVTKTSGIDVRAEGVTIDLMGFEIRKTGGSGNGIEVDHLSHRCTITNGSITGFASGIRCFPSSGSSRSGMAHALSVSACTTEGLRLGTGWTITACRAHDNPGIGIFTGDGCHLSGCTARSNGATGIQTGDSCILDGCTADENNPGSGIYAGNGCTLTNCTARGNVSNSNQAVALRAGDGSTLTGCVAHGNESTGSLGHGITAGAGSTLTDCTATSNRHTGITAGYGIFANHSTLHSCTADSNSSTGSLSWGIAVSNPCTLIGCHASFNTNTSAPVDFNKGGGIFAATACTIKDCTASNNSGDGIRVRFRCLVSGNNCDSNGAGAADGAGIHASDTGNRIEGNNVTSNKRGLDVDGAGNIVIRNSASLNISNYEIVTLNKVGVIVVAPGSGAISGASGGAGVGTTDPWANFSF